ncbi:MAG: exodeoxyribonuclease VII large subunit, partial [Pseudomonadota bacterium]
RRERSLARSLEDRRARVRDLGRALPRAEELLQLPRQRLDAAGERLPRALLACVNAQEVRLGRLAGRLQPSALTRRIETSSERVQIFAARLGPALSRTSEQARDRFDKLARLLESFSYKATLERGYAAVRGENGVLDSVAKVEAGATLEIEFADGRVDAVAGGERGGPRRRKKNPGSTEGGAQGSLF